MTTFNRMQKLAGLKEENGTTYSKLYAQYIEDNEAVERGELEFLSESEEGRDLAWNALYELLPERIPLIVKSVAYTGVDGMPGKAEKAFIWGTEKILVNFEVPTKDAFTLILQLLEELTLDYSDPQEAVAQLVQTLVPFDYLHDDLTQEFYEEGKEPVTLETMLEDYLDVLFDYRSSYESKKFNKDVTYNKTFDKLWDMRINQESKVVDWDIDYDNSDFAKATEEEVEQHLMNGTYYNEKYGDRNYYFVGIGKTEEDMNIVGFA